MDVVIGRPVVVRAPCEVGTDDLVADLKARHDHSKLAVWLRMLRSTGVVQRPWSAPPAVTVGREGIGVRSRAAYEASRDRAVTAAQDALARSGLGPGDVDVLITSHTTSWTIPGLDVDLVGRLGLRPDVQRIGLATAACVGGGHGLVHAVRSLRGRAGWRALGGGRRGPLHPLPHRLGRDPYAGRPVCRAVRGRGGRGRRLRCRGGGRGRPGGGGRVGAGPAGQLGRVLGCDP
ncbi:hypothetical protein JHN53_13445 [Streptomyces sp. MBT58]|nr:hypothetical protein [Streptomyces sp. MBT58]